MNFFQNILNSIYNPVFYQKLPKKSLSSAFGYYFLLSLLLTFISLLAIITPTTAGIKRLTDTVIPQALQSYPKDLTIMIKNGQVSTNVKEPYFVSLPPQQQQNGMKNLLVIDTTTPFTDEKFEQYSTISVLTKDHLYYQDSKKGEIRGYDLGKTTDITINQAFLKDTVKKYSPLLQYALPFILFFAFLGMLFVYVLRLIQLLILALFIFLLMKLIKPTLTYSNAYKTALFGVTAGLLLETFASVTNPVFHFGGFPFMTTLITLIVVIINNKAEK